MHVTHLVPETTPNLTNSRRPAHLFCHRLHVPAL